MRTSSAASRGRLRLALEAVGERAAFDQFQGEERLAVVLADLEDLDDVRVLQLGGGRRLGPEPGELVGPGVAGPEDHLEGDEAVQRLLPRLVDDAHAAATELGQDLVARRGEVDRGLAGRTVRRRRPSSAVRSRSRLGTEIDRSGRRTRWGMRMIMTTGECANGRCAMSEPMSGDPVADSAGVQLRSDTSAESRRMAKDTIGVGFIGAGDISILHAAAVKKCPGAKLVGLWNRSQDRAKQRAAEFGCKNYATPEALVERPGHRRRVRPHQPGNAPRIHEARARTPASTSWSRSRSG